jgi:hypothetical protein
VAHQTLETLVVAVVVQVLRQQIKTVVLAHLYIHLGQLQLQQVYRVFMPVAVAVVLATVRQVAQVVQVAVVLVQQGKVLEHLELQTLAVAVVVLGLLQTM